MDEKIYGQKNETVKLEKKIQIWRNSFRKLMINEFMITKKTIIDEDDDDVSSNR
jgi:hypothetical protein